MNFKKPLEGISHKVLTGNLRSMEADGIVIRTAFPEVPPKVEYALSELGGTIRSILVAMEIWGVSYKEMRSWSRKAGSGQSLNFL